MIETRTDLQENMLENGAGDLGAIRPRPLSRLTYRILSFNILVVFIIAMGLTYMGTIRQNLVESRVTNFGTESILYADLIGRFLDKESVLDERSLESQISVLNTRANQKIMIYNSGGDLIYNNGSLELSRRAEEQNSTLYRIMSGISDLFSVTFHLPRLPDLDDGKTLSKFEQGLNKREQKIAAWSSRDGGLVLTFFSPLYKDGQVVGGMRLIRRDVDVENMFAETRLEIFRFLILSMMITIAHSLYLAGLIGHPLRKLAMAAEAYRLNRGRYVDIPDMSSRRDEIGELSQAMREMADSLQKRLSSIEQFAADVAHELKNPLTSLRSALETMLLVKSEDDRGKLMGIALHDLQRMDRLISDISQASRLDAELSRGELFAIDLRDILLPLIEEHRHVDGRSMLVCNGLDHPVYIYGQAGRLEQVFQNLIGNAQSFAPENSQVVITVHDTPERVKVTVDDSGSGIPENRLDKIFDRFYSERPVSEGFGMHSGLGLSIAKQIVDAHGGSIVAENRKDGNGNILGARFTVRLKSADMAGR